MEDTLGISQMQPKAWPMDCGHNLNHSGLGNGRKLKMIQEYDVSNFPFLQGNS